MLKIRNLSIPGILQNVNLDIPDNCLFGIIGQNGAGKTSLLKAIAGLIDFVGEITWSGPGKERLAHLVPQSPAVPFPYTVLEIVCMGMYPKKADPEKVLDAMQRTHVSHLTDRPITRISAGEKQRVYIARGLVADCPILLFDEPTANLDIKQQQEIWKLLHSLIATKRTIIVANHDLSSTGQYCDWVGVIYEGNCISGQTQVVMTDENMARMFSIS